MDRLAALDSEAAPAPGTARVTINDAAEDMEDIPPEQILDEFYKLIQEVQGDIRSIQSGSTQLQAKHAEKLQTADLRKAEEIGGEIQTLTNDINKVTKGVKDKLDRMKKNTEKLKKSPEAVAANAAVIKIQENQHAHLLRTFLQVVTAYQQLQGENEKQYREQTERRIRMRYTNEDGTTIDDERARELAQEAIELGTENAIFQQSKDTLAMIIENRNDIVRIEQAMRELNQLFSDLAVLVNEQGEVMDQILTNVQQANQYVEKGRKELAKAKKHAKKSRKKFCFLICGVAILLGFMLAIVLGYTIKI